MAKVKVLAPFVTLKVEDPIAGTRLVGYLKDCVVDHVEAASLEHHLDLGMVEEYVEPEIEEPSDPVDPVTESPGDEPPKGNASREEWAAYAASKGAPEEDTRPVEDGGLKQTELREKYGN